MHNKKQHIWKLKAETEVEAKDPHVQKSADSSWRGRKECCDGLLISLRGEFGNPFITYENLSPLCQRSAISLTPGTGFMKDNFSMQPQGRRGTFLFRLPLTSCCTDWFLTGHRQVLVSVHGPGGSGPLLFVIQFTTLKIWGEAITEHTAKWIAEVNFLRFTNKRNNPRFLSDYIPKLKTFLDLKTFLVS